MSEALSRPLFADEPLVFVDLETTGGTASADRITEIGVVEVCDGVVSTWSTLLDPQQPIPPFIQRLTGITPAMVRGAPTFAEIAPGLFERLGGRLFIAHNASFDYGFLRAEFERVGLLFSADVLCTVRLSRALFPREARHGLDALIERHALVPSARHRALADADLIWQFWQQLPGLVPADRLRAGFERVVRRQRLAAEIDEERLAAAPAGCGVYVLFGEEGVPLYVGRSVRMRQRLRALLTGERRSSRELRMTQQVRRVEWRETAGELGAMLTEAQWIASMRPSFNRAPARTRGGATPWPFDGAIACEEAGRPGAFQLIDDWCYLGQAETLEQAAALVLQAAEGQVPAFEPATCRIVQAWIARGGSVVELGRTAEAGLRAADVSA
jgi:DNA polymerase III subunit epsilon